MRLVSAATAALLLNGIFLFNIAWSSAGEDAFSSSSRPLPPDYEIHADGSVSLRLCFNWSCASRQRLTFSATEMNEVVQQMAWCPGP